jgi:DNA polymerase-4
VERTILHVDMDAFFASVELLRRPELRGQPVVVGGNGPRGVVAAASYEARSYGVFSAMPSGRARRLCPKAVFLPGDHAHYAEVSARVMEIFRSVTPLVEPLSLDEAFLDVTGARRRAGDGPTIARWLRRTVLEQEGLTCSVGVAPVKFLAKLATNDAKPRPSRSGPVFGPGVSVIEPGGELAFLHPLPVGALWGVGPATLTRLERYGVRTVGDLAQLPLATLESAVGRAHGRHLHDLAHAVDPRSVDPAQEVKSISHEETYPTDRFDPGELRTEAVRMADAVAARLRRHGSVARTVTIKVRFGDFRTITRSATPAEAVATGPAVARVAKDLLARVDVAPGVRLLGVGVSNLVAPGAGGAGEQLSLLDDLAPAAPDAAGTEGGDAAPAAPAGGGAAAWAAATDAVDRARERYGADAVVPASLAGPAGISVRRRGDQQWGPDQAG